MMNNIYEKSILLIGPSGAGKSTIAEELSKRTGMPRLCLDVIANGMYKDRTLMSKFSTPDQFKEYLLKSALEGAQVPGVCDFGAGHSIYKDNIIFERIKNLLLPFNNIVLLLPTSDVGYSLEILNSRTTSIDGKRENLDFLLSQCNEELATIIIYTNDKTPEEIADEILSMINEKSMSTKPANI